VKKTATPEPKNRARLEILNHIAQFCLSQDFGDRIRWGGPHAFHTTYDERVQIGDLIALQSAPTSKWYFSWLIEIEVWPGGSRYLLESIEDGTLCWWHNVGLYFLDRKVLADYPSWRWTDKQFAFKDRWWRVCFKDKDAYLTLPTFPIFGEDHRVTLGTRTRFGLDDHRPQKTFPDWRKVTKAMMAEFYDECEASRPTAKAS